MLGVSEKTTIKTARGSIASTERDAVLVLGFGSQYSQLIARRIREAGVYSELVPVDISADEVKRRNPSGLIFSGGPASVTRPWCPRPDQRLYELDLPILGICCGMQLLAHDLGGSMRRSGRREYGRAALTIDDPAPLFAQLPASMNVWMSHRDEVEELQADSNPSPGRITLSAQGWPMGVAASVYSFIRK